MPKLTKELADNITLTCAEQLGVSEKFKQPRMAQIKESEDLYFGIVQKTLKNPFNYSFPFMSGFVDHFLSKIDDPPEINFEPQDEADFKVAEKVTAAFAKEKSSVLPEAKWALKDRWVKKMGIFSGRGIYKYFAESPGGIYTPNFSAVDYYDFHCEPDGGGHLDNHIFKGHDFIYKTKEELLTGVKDGYYDQMQVADLIGNYNEDDYKDNEDDMGSRNNRAQAMKLDPVSNNYLGEPTFRFAEWYLLYKGVQWYVLWEVKTKKWIRIKPLEEIIPKKLSPFVSWATHEEARLFWSKAPADDARPLAQYLNKLLNQELYNREKQNTGQRAYDAEMFHDVEALSHWRPDGLVPADTRNGNKPIAAGIYEFKVSGLSGGVDMVKFLDSFFGQKTGSTPGSQGATEGGKKVGIYFGELEQVNQFIGVRNKSFREAWAELGLRYVYGLDEHLHNDEIQIKLMGAGGIEWNKLTKNDLKRNRMLDIKITGGNEEKEKSAIEKQVKTNALTQVLTANPRWKDEEILKNAGYTEEDIKKAFSMLPPASEKLMSEAAQAIQDIVQKKSPQLNRAANSAFMQKVVDYAVSNDLKQDIYDALIEFAISHGEIAAENEARAAMKFLQEANNSVPEKKGIDIPIKNNVNTPEGAGISIGNNASNQLKQ